MDKRVKKDLIYLLIGLTIAFSICFAIFDTIIEDGIERYDMQNASFKEKVRLFLDIDGCLDDGYCKEGLILHNEDGKEFVLNKNTCLENKGKWIEDAKSCNFR